MDLQQRELRRAAAQAFAESLNKLGDTLCTPETQPTSAAPDLTIDFEQALADLERFMHEKEEQG